MTRKGDLLVPLAIWGASGHAKVVADIVRAAKHYVIAGFIDDINIEKHGHEFCNSTIVGGRESLTTLRDSGVNHIVLGIGDCHARLALSSVVSEVGFVHATLIHPQAVLARDIAIEYGTVAMAGAIVNSGAHIGHNVILNTSSSVDHDCEIENGVHIGPGAHLAGNVFVGQATWIGIGAIIKEKTRIGKNTIIGAGAVVLSDVPDNVVAFGNPARVIRSNP
jgi:UDP-N-acetylbacillosamine N-acetyltransferase